MTPVLRTSSPEVPAEALAARNDAEARTGAARFQSRAIELAAMQRVLEATGPRGTLRGVDATTQCRWVGHPDEAIRVAYLRATGWDVQFQPGVKEVYHAVHTAALREARRAHELWNPYLDVLAERQIRDVSGPWKRLAAWVAAQTEPRALDPLTAFRSFSALRLLATAPALDDAHEVALYPALSLLLAMAARSELTTGQAARLWQWAAARLPAPGAAVGLDAGYGAYQVVEALLARRAPGLPPDAPATALQWSCDGVGHAELATTVCDQPEVTPADAAVLYARRGSAGAPRLREALLRHPKMPLEVLRREVASAREPALLAAIAAHPCAPGDAAVCDALLAAGGIDVAMAVARHAPPAWLATRFRRWAASTPERLLDLLEQEAVPPGFAITPEQALALLAHDQPRVRARAVYVVPQYIARTPAPAPAASPDASQGATTAVSRACRTP